MALSYTTGRRGRLWQDPDTSTEIIRRALDAAAWFVAERAELVAVHRRADHERLAAVVETFLSHGGFRLS